MAPPAPAPFVKTVCFNNLRKETEPLGFYIMNAIFDQRSPHPPEVGVLRWRRQIDGHGDSMTDPAQIAESVKIVYPVNTVTTIDNAY